MRADWVDYWELTKIMPLASVIEFSMGVPCDELTDVADIANAQGCEVGELATVGDLIGADFMQIVQGMGGGNGRELTPEAAARLEIVSYWMQKVRFLPDVAERAISGDWDGFSSRVQQIHETMPEAFEIFYPYMPDEYRREFVVGCYDNHGDAVDGCREALKQLPKGGAGELPDDLRGQDVITVYRAGREGMDDAPFSFSWTTSRPVANFFYNRHDGGHVYKASLRTCDVIAYDDDRNEREVLQYGDVYDVEEIEADPQEGREWAKGIRDREIEWLEGVANEAFDAEHDQLLDELSEQTGKSRGDILRQMFHDSVEHKTDTLEKLFDGGDHA